MTDEHTPRPSLAIRMALAHPWRVVLAWIVTFVVAIGIVGTLLGSALNNNEATTNDPESRRASDLVYEHIDERAGVDEVLVIRSERHRADSPEFQAFLAPLVEQADEVGVKVAAVGLPGADAAPAPPSPAASAAEGSSPPSRVSAAGPPISEDGRAMLVPLTFTRDALASAERLADAVREADRDPDFSVDVTGNFTLDNDFTELSERDLKEGELYVGLPVAMLVLLLVFGTIVGALMPIMIAIVAIVCALALTALIGQAWEINLFVVNMISGMGLALGIDYSLFVV